MDEYLLDLNATKAAIRAGYSPSSAHVTSSRLLARAEVRAHLETVMADRFKVDKLTIIEELAAIAFHDIGDYLTWSNTDLRTVPSRRLSTAQLKAIASVRRTGSGYVELRMHDKLKALELLARVAGLLGGTPSGSPFGTVQFIIETP